MNKKIIDLILISSFFNCTIVSSVQAADNANRVQNLLQKNYCTQAEELVRQEEENSSNRSIVPTWYLQLIECYGKFGKERSDLDWRIDVFLNKQVDKMIEKKECNYADTFLKQLNNNLRAHWGYRSGLYKVAKCYEGTNSNKSKSIYNHLIKGYPRSTEAEQAKQRINFLLGNLTWIYPKSTTVIDGVKTALHNRDISMLRQYASKSNYQIGFEEEISPVQFDEKGKDIFQSALARSVAQIDILRSEPHKYTLLVIFPANDHPYWYFTFEELEGGWQWTGVIISNMQKMQNQ